MNLVIENKIIDEPIPDILKQLKSELHNGLLKDIGKVKNGNVRITCPFHKDGHESNPSCDIFCGESDKTEYGTYKCFTCGETGPLYRLIGYCFGKDDNFGKEWLLDHYGYKIVSRELYLPEISVESGQENILDESILDKFQSWHPYMEKRKLSKQICNKFKIKYDPQTKCIIFPVRDEYGQLVFLTRRSVLDKTFIIPEDVDKPIYLLDEVKKNHIDEVIICESQINALYCWSMGYVGVGLFGTGSKKQYQILNKSNIRHYFLAFDGDEPGRKGIKRFINNIRKDVFIDVICLPQGKDVNDLTLP